MTTKTSLSCKEHPHFTASQPPSTKEPVATSGWEALLSGDSSDEEFEEHGIYATDYQEDEPGRIGHGNVLQAYETPFCCGVDILTGFGHESDGPYAHKPDVGEITKDLKNMKNAFGTTNKLVFLNHLQAASIGQLVIDAGYKEIARFYSKAHGNDIVIYLSSTEKAKHPAINGGKASKTKQRGRKK